MLNGILWDEFLKAIKCEVVPALGCTEPIALALASAVSASHLDGPIDRIEAAVSPNLLKNGMGVTVPGTGKIGLPIAAAAGAFGGNATLGLEVLRDLTEEAVAEAKRLVAENRVKIDIATAQNAIYCESCLFSGQDWVRTSIVDQHTNIVSIVKNDTVIFEKEYDGETSQKPPYCFNGAKAKDIYEFARDVPYAEIEFILKAGALNDALSQEGLKKSYGLHIGATLKRQMEQGLLADDLLTKILVRSTAASDARMGGATLPAMSNSGSGNQGIAATMPVIVVADYLAVSDEQRARALTLSHLMAIYIHDKLPRLSALCAVTTAAMGSAAGMGWLLSKGQYEPIGMAICSMIGDLSGMICDGASNSCAMKVSTSAGSAFKAVLMALDSSRVTENEGIVCHDVDQSIDNLCALANGSMRHTDAQIIDIMFNKTKTPA